MNKKTICACISLFLVFGLLFPDYSHAAGARLKVGALYDTSSQIRGNAAPKRTVKVKIGKKVYRAKVNKKGKFSIKIPRQKAGKKLVVRLYKGRTVLKKKTVRVYAAHVFYEEGFSYHKISSSVKSRISGKSYRKNPDVSLDDLRYVNIKYVNFSGNEKDGELIVNRRIAKDTVQIFYELYTQKYPLQEVSLIDKYSANDNRSMRANNTSSFNYRKIAGSKKLSRHALGMAIDINPQINPYVKGTTVEPANGKVYVQRDVKKCSGKYAAAMIHKNDFIYKLFKKHGFTWGGDWKALKDYQHFEK